ncbi:MAG: Myo-inositol 2-dehydrogenase [uncultured Thermomicrobiales bacterium]|uniref:Myo-inositol 2-dehydrogenase n=1 Tax=uncultured Thermomicrobiales bacterium TaxID=1645740 RepID=A0A6J4UYJ0_9BACT|nr:MAG: Myo-inositol 2-dehydrogenase [uncultured Thermomicrobiales bacterium]
MSSATPRPIRLGIIGTGLAVEQLHWPALRQMPDRFTVAAFANHTRPKAEGFAGYSGASMDDYHQDYRELLRRDDVETVLISLPIPLNYGVTREALEAGKDVICEKPPGANLAEGQAYLALADEFPDRTVLVAENFFYRDDLRLARSLLDEEVIGRLHLMSWRNVSRLVPQLGKFSSTPWRHEAQYQGGPHLDAGVHHTAQIRLLCGDVQRVHGEIQDANGTHGGPSDLTLTLRFASGAIGGYTASYPELAIPPEPNEMRLYGERGVLVVANRRVAVHRPDQPTEEHRLEEGDGGYYNEFLNYYDAVVHGEPLVGTIAQSYHNMLIIARGLESAERGEALTLDDAPGGLAATSVPLWRPRGASGLLDGLPGRIVTETREG